MLSKHVMPYCLQKKMLTYNLFVIFTCLICLQKAEGSKPQEIQGIS